MRLLLYGTVTALEVYEISVLIIRPYIMFTCPELYNTIDYLCAADGVKLECCRQQCLAKTVVPCDDTVFELCCIIMQDSGWDFPYSAREGIDLYINLRREILSLL